MKNSVDILYEQYVGLKSFLEKRSQLTYINDYTSTFRKVLLLAAASYFEDEISKTIDEFIEINTKESKKINAFIRKFYKKDKYFQLFEWGNKDNIEKSAVHINGFWKYFGDDFFLQIETVLKNNEEIINSIKFFQKIGHSRNILVHSNFASYDYTTLTPEEIYQTFRDALPFLGFLNKYLISQQ